MCNTYLYMYYFPHRFDHLFENSRFWVPTSCLRKLCMRLAVRHIPPTCVRKVDIRLSGKGDSNSHGARPVYSNHLDDSNQ